MSRGQGVCRVGIACVHSPSPSAPTYIAHANPNNTTQTNHTPSHRLCTHPHRNCPECRARASNPHANIALLRLLDALDGSTGPASTADNNSQQQSQQQQPRNQQPLSAFSPGGVFRSPGAGNEPLGSLGTMLNQVTAAIPGVTAAAAAGAGGGGGGINANSNAPAVVALPGSIAIHKANIAQLRTSMWVYLTPLLGALYILSPLDVSQCVAAGGWVGCCGVLWRACVFSNEVGQGKM